MYKKGVIYPGTAFVRVQSFTSTWFLIHNFGPRYARKPIKGSKDPDHSIVSKKMAHWVGAQGLGTVSQKV